MKEIVLIMLKGKIKSIYTHRDYVGEAGHGKAETESPIFMHIKQLNSSVLNINRIMDFQF